ncbi:MAG: hypothetical protein ACE5JR_11630 [Gemmatimonadota bacterium]
MTAGAGSPRIAGLSWGRVDVEGHGAFKDAKLFPGWGTRVELERDGY